MSAFFAERALLPNGWANDVRLEVSADGVLTKVEANASADAAERLRGPVLAGMPNLHSHAFQRAMAGLAEVAGNPNDSFWTWRDLMYRMVGKISPEPLQVLAQQLYIEMLKAGYPSVAEFHSVHRHWPRPESTGRRCPPQGVHRWPIHQAAVRVRQRMRT